MKKESNILKWLKRIFSIQTVSVLVAVIAAFFTYKNYVDNKPASSISITCADWTDDWEVKEFIDFSKTTDIFNLHVANTGVVDLNVHGGLPMGDFTTFPIIHNTSNKTIKNLRCDIAIWFDKNLEPSFRDIELNTKMKVIDNTDKFGESNVIRLKYEDDFLASDDYIPEPFPFLWLPYSEVTGSLEEGYAGEFSISYKITFEGLKKPIFFSYTTRIYYYDYTDTTEKEKITNNLLHAFLENTIYSNLMKYRKEDNGQWAIIVNRHVVNNVKHIKPDSFSKDIYTTIDDLQK